MSGLDALQSVQFVTAKGKRFAILSADDWEALIEWLETLEDTQIAQQAFAELKAAGGDRKGAGWLAWNSAAEEIR
ncbi:MAG: hypothetical protein HY679_05540 [Chloroflexi bacterium]|nr:hypothetical protein [Chloroflexota bacterium]